MNFFFQNFPGAHYDSSLVSPSLVVTTDAMIHVLVAGIMQHVRCAVITNYGSSHRTNPQKTLHERDITIHDRSLYSSCTIADVVQSCKAASHLSTILNSNENPDNTKNFTGQGFKFAVLVR